jgi:microcystin-dependent protein
MEYFLGEILLLPYSFAPLYTVPCYGQLLAISDFPALYALLGDRFGGDGRATFAVPDLRGAEPVEGLEYCIVTQGIFPQRD